jgi:hypothetical protein
MDKKQWTVTEAVERFWEMAETANAGAASKVKAHVADRVPIALLDGRNIWTYEHVGDEWVRFQMELTTPEAARRRMEPLRNEHYCLVPQVDGQNHTKTIEWLDNMTRARVGTVKWGFIRCEDDKEQPGVLTCVHVMFAGAPVKDYVIPAPLQAKYGEALCADCADGKGQEDDKFITCYHCYLRSQNCVKVTETYVVVGNKGDHADIARDGDNKEFHIRRPAGMSIADFQAAYPVDKIVELSRMVEQRVAASKRAAVSA